MEELYTINYFKQILSLTDNKGFFFFSHKKMTQVADMARRLEHLLLLYRIWFPVVSPSEQFTITFNSSPRGSVYWPLWLLYSLAQSPPHTHFQKIK